MQQLKRAGARLGVACLVGVPAWLGVWAERLEGGRGGCRGKEGAAAAAQASLLLHPSSAILVRRPTADWGLGWEPRMEGSVLGKERPAAGRGRQWLRAADCRSRGEQRHRAMVIGGTGGDLAADGRDLGPRARSRRGSHDPLPRGRYLVLPYSINLEY